jgi:hypothetical protein
MLEKGDRCIGAGMLPAGEIREALEALVKGRLRSDGAVADQSDVKQAV